MVVVDAAATTLTYASAGHPPALLCGPAGAFSWLDDASRPPPGLAGDDRYEERTIAFEPGSSVVLYSDGLVERRWASIGEGLRKLENRAHDLVRCDALELDDAVKRWLDETGPTSDDVVVVPITRTPAIEH